LDQLWLEAFRYNKWANLHLLDVCAKLSNDQLHSTAPGTYGTVADTFLHMLAAEQRYLARFGAGKPQIKEGDEFPGIALLKQHATTSGDKLIEAATRVTPEDTIDENRHGRLSQLHLGVVIIQALHHGNDHRTHICTILGHHQIPYGEMDVWAYGEATGAITRVPLKS
jgi:uncharacterized damage-inducible protein DinB